jgi:hypothetical protein
MRSMPGNVKRKMRKTTKIAAYLAHRFRECFLYLAHRFSDKMTIPTYSRD